MRKLDLESEEYLRRSRGVAVPPEALTVEAIRAIPPKPLWVTGVPRDIGDVEQLEIPRDDRPDSALGATVYRPPGNKPRPIALFFHGGGWVKGELANFDSLCHELCAELAAIVISIDYRLAPEYKFPMQVDDAWLALRFVNQHHRELGGNGQLIVAGDSAGANLAAATTLRDRDEGLFAIHHQLLLYPATDFGFDTDSHRENATGYMLTTEALHFYWDCYLRDEADADHPWASPLRAKDHSSLPPATIITAEFDPLRDDGELYAEALTKAGNDVWLHREPGTVHGFCIALGAISAAKRIIAEAAARIRASLEASTPRLIDPTD